MTTEIDKEELRAFMGVNKPIRCNRHQKATSKMLSSQLRMEVSRGSSPDVIRQLVSRGADVNCTDSLGYTPLLTAASSFQPQFELNQNEMIAVLCELGADVNYTSDVFFMDTALHIVALCGNQHATRTLLQFGANVHLRNYAGYTPLHVATVNGHSEVVKLLYLAGADIESKEFYCYYSPVHLASIRGHLGVLEVLILYCGARIKMRDRTGYTATDRCVSKEILNFLTEKQKNPMELKSLSLCAVRTLVVQFSCKIDTLPLPHTLIKKL